MWTLVSTEVKYNRLSHTSTQVGSYLFIIGGHNGQTYAQDVLLLNLGEYRLVKRADDSHFAMGVEDTSWYCSTWPRLSCRLVARREDIHFRWI